MLKADIYQEITLKCQLGYKRLKFPTFVFINVKKLNLFFLKLLVNKKNETKNKNKFLLLKL
jgi:hypothetical protein